MKLKKFYNQIKKKEIKYFFNSKQIYKEFFNLLQKFPSKNIEKIMELGCGDLRNFNILKKIKFKKYTAVDWIDFENKKFDKRIIFKKQSIEKLDLKEKFNVIISVGTFEHFENPWSIISNLKKNMYKGSKLIFSVPNYINPRGLILLTIKELFKKKISKSDIYFFKPEEIKNKLKNMGFKKISIQTIRRNETFGKTAKLDLKQRLKKIINKENSKKIGNLLDFFDIYSKHYVPNKLTGRVFVISIEK